MLQFFFIYILVVRVIVAAEQFKAIVGESGRVFLPSKIRKKMHINVGDQIVFVMDRDLKIVRFKDTLSKIQNRVKELNKSNISLVDSLIESRRIEAQNE